MLAYARPRGTREVRVDDAIEPGTVVDTSYDSLLAKVIAHGTDRAQALGRLERALADFTVLGVTTTTGYLRGLLADAAVRAGELDTGLIERRGVPAGPIGDEGVAIAAAMLILADRAASAGRIRSSASTAGASAARARLALAPLGRRRRARRGTVPPEYVAMVSPLGDGRFAIEGRGEWLLARDGDATWIGHGGSAWAVRPASAVGSATPRPTATCARRCPDRCCSCTPRSVTG